MILRDFNSFLITLNKKIEKIGDKKYHLRRFSIFRILLLFEFFPFLKCFVFSEIINIIPTRTGDFLTLFINENK